jgi:hypothetical protein
VALHYGSSDEGSSTSAERVERQLRTTTVAAYCCDMHCFEIGLCLLHSLLNGCDSYTHVTALSCRFQTSPSSCQAKLRQMHL